MGNATRDARQLENDGPDTALIRVAVTGRYFDQSKNAFEDRKTEFISVFARRALARHVLTSVKKGDPLIITGRIGSSEWTKEDGSSGISLTLQADAIGHDLSFGTTGFVRPSRDTDIPNHDEKTGEVIEDGHDTTERADTYSITEGEGPDRSLVGT